MVKVHNKHYIDYKKGKHLHKKARTTRHSITENEKELRRNIANNHSWRRKNLGVNKLKRRVQTKRTKRTLKAHGW